MLSMSTSIKLDSLNGREIGCRDGENEGPNLLEIGSGHGGILTTSVDLIGPRTATRPANGRLQGCALQRSFGSI